MQINTYKISNFDYQIPYHPITRSAAGAIPSRTSPVLSRQELQRVILEMVD
jgi:hypothetical protein